MATVENKPITDQSNIYPKKSSQLEVATSDAAANEDTPSSTIDEKVNPQSGPPSQQVEEIQTYTDTAKITIVQPNDGKSPLYKGEISNKPFNQRVADIFTKRLHHLIEYNAKVLDQSLKLTQYERDGNVYPIRLFTLQDLEPSEADSLLQRLISYSKLHSMNRSKGEGSKRYTYFISCSITQLNKLLNDMHGMKRIQQLQNLRIHSSSYHIDISTVKHRLAYELVTQSLDHFKNVPDEEKPDHSVLVQTNSITCKYFLFYSVMNDKQNYKPDNNESISGKYVNTTLQHAAKIKSNKQHNKSHKKSAKSQQSDDTSNSTGESTDNKLNNNQLVNEKDQPDEEADVNGESVDNNDESAVNNDKPAEEQYVNPLMRSINSLKNYWYASFVVIISLIIIFYYI